MSSLNSALKAIRDLKDSIAPYRGFASEVDDTLDDLTEMENLIKEPTPEKIDKAMERLNACKRRAEPYGYYPQIQEFLEALAEIEKYLKETKE